jgi:hypothetical protein
MTAALVVFAFLLGLSLFAWGLKGWIRGRAAAHWPTVQGRMVSAALDEKTVIAGRARFRQHILKVECEFEVGGQRFTCHRLTPFPGDPAFGRRADAEELLAKFSAGQVVDVHVHPSDPQRSVLLPSASTRMQQNRTVMLSGLMVYLTAAALGFVLLN